MQTFKSPLRYPGGKTNAIKHLLRHVINNGDTIISPFLGGGSLELILTQLGYKVIASDRYEPLATFWQVLLSQPRELYDKILEYYPCSNHEFTHLKNNFYNHHNWLERAAVFYVLNRVSYGGLTMLGGYTNNHPSFTISNIQKVKSFKNDRLSVTHADFKYALAKHSNKFAYLDPPYFIDKTLYPGQKTFEHLELFEILKNRKYWVLSYNDCPFIRNLYKGFKMKKIDFLYRMSPISKTELLIFSRNF